MEYLIEEDSTQTMNDIGRFINGVCGPKYGFVTLVFDFNATGAGLFVTNANRADMVKMLRDRADDLEQGVVFDGIGDKH